MIVFFTSMHAGAYFPSQNYGSARQMWDASVGRMSHSWNNWKEYHYCACILITFLVIYPFMFFVYLLTDGFNPYDNLTKAEMKYHAHNTGVEKLF